MYKTLPIIAVLASVVIVAAMVPTTAQAFLTPVWSPYSGGWGSFGSGYGSYGYSGCGYSSCGYSYPYYSGYGYYGGHGHRGGFPFFGGAGFGRSFFGGGFGY